MPTPISARRFNLLQSRVAEILGNGVGTSGYGQQISSSPVSGRVDGEITQSTDVVDADDMINLLDDIIRCRKHQLGESAVIALEEVREQLDVVEETGTKGIADYETLVTQLEQDKFSFDIATQAETQFITTSERTEIWNEFVTHKFSVEFASASRRRHFFNAGGEILIQPELDISGIASPNLKTQVWASLIANVGTVKMNHTRTTTDAVIDPTVTTTNIGNYDLTTEFQTIFSKTVTGSYADIDYTVRARESFDNTIEFECRFVDDSEPTELPTFTLSTVSGNIVFDEGETFTVKLETTLLPEGTRIPYRISGVSSNDIGGVPLTGDLFTDSNGEATATFTITEDNITEGDPENPVPETFVFTLGNGEASLSIDINDTSRGPVYLLSLEDEFNTTLNEGDSVTFVINTENVAPGTTLFYNITGTVSRQDFTDDTLTGSFVVSGTTESATATVTKTLVEDLTTEETIETFEFEIQNSDGDRLATPIEIAVNDTSKTPAPNFIDVSWSPSIGNINDDNFVVNYDVQYAETLTYTLTGPSGVITSGASVEPGAGTVDVGVLTNAGNYTIQFTATNITATVTDDATLQVLGTPSYVASGPATVNEGSNATYLLETVNVVPSTTFYYDVTGISNADITNGSRQGSVQINAQGNAIVTLGISADKTTEGPETLTLTWYEESQGGTNRGSVQTVIDDTSLNDPEFSIIAPNSVNEGATLTFNIETDFFLGNTLYYSISGISDSDLSSGSRSGSLSLDGNGNASVSVTLDNDLSRNEGDETLRFSLRTGSISGTEVANKSVTVRDTSQFPEPVYNIQETLGRTSVNEGGVLGFEIQTVNVPNGTTLYWTIGGDVNINDLSVGLDSGSVTINNGEASVAAGISADQLTEGAETLIFQLRTGSTSGSIVRTYSVRINDTSTTPIPDLSVTMLAVGGGGSSGFVSLPVASSVNSPGAGGGGGIGTRSNYNLQPGDSLSVNIGSGGNLGNGNDSRITINGSNVAVGNGGGMGGVILGQAAGSGSSGGGGGGGAATVDVRDFPNGTVRGAKGNGGGRGGNGFVTGVGTPAANFTGGLQSGAGGGHNSNGGDGRFSTTPPNGGSTTTVVIGGGFPGYEYSGGGGGAVVYYENTVQTVATANGNGSTKPGAGGDTWVYSTQTSSASSDPGRTGEVLIYYAGSRKASGGSVRSWNGYTIHRFTSSGTFRYNP